MALGEGSIGILQRPTDSVPVEPVSDSAAAKLLSDATRPNKAPGQDVLLPPNFGTENDVGAPSLSDPPAGTNFHVIGGNGSSDFTIDSSGNQVPTKLDLTEDQSLFVVDTREGDRVREVNARIMQDYERRLAQYNQHREKNIANGVPEPLLPHMEDPPPPKIYFHAANSQSFTDASSTGLGRWAQGEFAAIPTGERASLIKQALKLTGVPDTVENEKAINIIALGESSWSNNPPDCHDSNWRAGHPSKGLMQMIPETFNSHKLAGHDDILNPLDNMCAAINYATSRYGGLTQVPGVIAVCNGQHYRGY